MLAGVAVKLAAARWFFRAEELPRRERSSARSALRCVNATPHGASRRGLGAYRWNFKAVEASLEAS